MASWETMADLATGDLVTETHLDAIRGNIEYNLTPNQDQVKYTAGTIVTASTSWVDMPYMELTVSTNGGHLRVEFCMKWSHSVAGGALLYWHFGGWGRARWD